MLAQFLPEQIFAFLLVFSRVGTAMMLMPGIGEAYVFARVRLSLALALSLVLLPLVQSQLPVMPAAPLALLVLIAGEVVQGVIVGGAARLLMSALTIAGMLISFQSSLAIAQSFDPNQGTQTALVGSFLSILGVLLVFVAGLHTMLIAGIHDSYELFPVGRLPPAGDLATLVVGIVSSAFAIGVQMSAPFIVYGMVFYIGLGIIQRLIPQIQLFFIMMPAQLMFAFFVIMVVLSTTLLVFLGHFEEQASRFLAP